MIEKRFVQWYASDAGVDLDIAEREVVLTYVLRILYDQDLLEHLAFKGGTAIRKLHLGSSGRFSLDLDFTAVGHITPEALILDLVEALHDRMHHGIRFTVPSPSYYVAEDRTGCGAEVIYEHDWATGARFGIQISFRAPPLLPVTLVHLKPARYFQWLQVDPPTVPALDIHEVIGEKTRAAAQRTRVRDLYDLYLFAHQPFDRALVRRIAVIKCWETRYAFDPAGVLHALADGAYDWVDLKRLVRADRLAAPDTIVRDVQQGFSFLRHLTEGEARLAQDPYGREQRTHDLLAHSLLGSGTAPG